MGLLETVTFKQRLGVEGVSHEDLWRKHPRQREQPA